MHRVGGRFSLHPTGVGECRPPSLHRRFRRRCWPPMRSFTPLTVASPVELRRILADARTRGFAVNDRQLTCSLA
ncbi:IclR family transcriptional regulator C-terminal domain-containing protein [Streptomyces sp. NL15-2K]|uniref:IclR family transcriptional regulator domain-containing protein n=1 Tax=Streptomyces sp. NL15-2K TaxID=376149 RepID=UPI000F582DAB|nr:MULTISPECIES: IclR family transcriptional regulator C-terminal domain-containing protein [Actinomycetes]WKX16294.1 IclR family transcriptional regulator C-terminal domain-containing protein [Kutzneria buriramensis]